MTIQICIKCKYKWRYTGKKRFNELYNQYISCPRCLSLNKLKMEVKDGENI